MNEDCSVVGGKGERNLERIEDVPNEWAQMAQRVEIYAPQSAVHLEHISCLVSLFELLNGCFIHHLAVYLYLIVNSHIRNGSKRSQEKEVCRRNNTLLPVGFVFPKDGLSSTT